jgi:hypothetical protein
MLCVIFYFECWVCVRVAIKMAVCCCSFDDSHVKISPIQGIPYKSQDKQARATHQMAVTGKLKQLIWCH